MRINFKNKNLDQQALLEEFVKNTGLESREFNTDLTIVYLESDEVLDLTKLTGVNLVLGPGIIPTLEATEFFESIQVVPRHEIRVRPQVTSVNHKNDLILKDQLFLLSNPTKQIKVAATANYKLTDFPFAFSTNEEKIFFLNISNINNLADFELAKFFNIWITESVLKAKPQSYKVGLLAYGAIGHEHNRAVSNVDGFELKAVCDSNPARIEVAKTLAPEVEGFTDAEAMLNSAIDLVVISTPPNSHFYWAKKALEKNKHVVLEKPMALTVAECDELMDLALEKQKTLVVYQNRRWDTDFLTIQKLISQNKLGQVFHAEIFVGGYGHPCNYWHSDQEVSGGAIYDWGSHFLDQALALFGKDIAYVSAIDHKLHWIDVTNADHSRVSLIYKNGLEVEFIYSDLAAALKPKYYILGSEGAIVGKWRQESVISRNEIGTLLEDELAPADASARIEFHDKHGSVTQVRSETAPKFQFHTDLFDWLNYQIPMKVVAQNSRDVVAVMQAAQKSAAGGGLPVVPLLKSDH